MGPHWERQGAPSPFPSYPCIPCTLWLKNFNHGLHRAHGFKQVTEHLDIRLATLTSCRHPRLSPNLFILKYQPRSPQKSVNLKNFSTLRAGYRRRAEPLRSKEIDELGPISSTLTLTRFFFGVIEILPVNVSPPISPEISEKTPLPRRW